MLTRIDLRGRHDADAMSTLPRAVLDVSSAVEQVRPVVEAVRDRGEEAVREATQRFDGVALTDLRVPRTALDEALAQLDPAVRAALEEAIARARTVSHGPAARRRGRLTSSTARPSPSAGCRSAAWASTSRAGSSPTRAAWS